ncbi:MAG: N-acetylmuramoyl-L-alanine amidase [Myxococcaceae bacterium]|nr:N-acetylmuramoyl-L-alanine amidase [Myxococcaceae bacterium]
MLEPRRTRVSPFSLRSLRPLHALALAAALSPLACSGESSDGAPTDVADHHDDGEGNTGAVSSPLAANDTVTTAVAQSCTTTSVKGLAVQLVEEIQCLRPNTLSRIDNTPGLALGSAVFPYLQTKAAQALVAAQKARGTTMSINSALRTLPQQFLLYRWYQTGRCGIGLAASPGTSNHEGAIAVDVNDNAGWRTSMQNKGFRWLGASDPVHYDFIGGGTVDLRGLSVKAFQRLWNRNHPGDLITEDGAYGPGTASRLAQSPVGGFAIGANCSKSADAGTDPGDDASAPAVVPQVPDATEPASTDPTSSASAPDTTESGYLTPTSHPTADASGCSLGGSATAGSAGSSTSLGFGLGLAAAMAIGARRRRRRA